MKLIVICDANRGVSFCGKPVGKDKAVNDSIQAIKDEYIVFNSPNVLWSQIDEVILFNLNRVYPSTYKFEFPPNKDFYLREFESFEGSSHEHITKEVYKT